MERTQSPLSQQSATRLGRQEKANLVNPVLGHHISQERLPAAVPELPNGQLHQPPKQSHAEDHTEEIEAASREEQCWRTGRLESKGNSEQTFNLILCEKYLQQQQDLHLVVRDFKKVFDRDWHAALWATMKEYNISANLIRVIKHLYDEATSAVLLNSSLGDWFQTTVGVWQECQLSPTLFNIFLERIMRDTLENHKGTVSTGGRTITKLHCADEINGLAGEEEELLGALSPFNHKGLHQGWTQTSLYLQVIHFTSHLSTSQAFLAYSAGTQHGNLPLARWPILFCGPTQEPCVSHSQHGKNRERFWKKCRWMDRKGRNRQGKNPWQ